jgi:hypothetical protein
VGLDTPMLGNPLETTTSLKLINASLESTEVVRKVFIGTPDPQQAIPRAWAFVTT